MARKLYALDAPAVQLHRVLKYFYVVSFIYAFRRERAQHLAADLANHLIGVRIGRLPAKAKVAQRLFLIQLHSRQ